MPKLYPEDQAKVDKVLSEETYRVDRQPFRLLRLMSVLLGFLLLVTVISYFLGQYYDLL